MNNDNKTDKDDATLPRLPEQAGLPINRCNLPAQILGGLSFQRHPVALHIDGVGILHTQLFQQLDGIGETTERARRFMDYMVVQFRLHRLEDAGLMADERRGKADYLSLLRGWLFNPDGREAAVLKAWVESRFGLLPRYHQGPLQDHEGHHYQAYLTARSEGLYATNALEAQLDLLYSYCQYELARVYRVDEHLRLYRGVNRIGELEVLECLDKNRAILLLNNLNAFSLSRERAEEFGDTIMQVDVPWQKCLFYSRLLPEHHIGEEEYLLIGGLYEISSRYW